MRIKNYIIIILSFYVLIGCRTKEKDNRTEFFPKIELKPNQIADSENIWVFILAGQSNMAGRGKVEPIDTIPNPRILSINKNGSLIVAKEPLHFYETSMTGLDCGLSFGKELLKHVPDNISLLIIPTAVGGSSISQWINDKSFRNVTLLSNFKDKVEIGKKYGKIKGVLWHQGENDATSKETIEIYDEQLRELFALFRNETDNQALPILLGELGTYSKTDESWREINSKIEEFIKTDSNVYLIRTSDLKHKGDNVHFNSEGQREIGKRFAEKFNETEIKPAHNNVYKK
jgi:hypothetical protein